MNSTRITPPSSRYAPGTHPLSRPGRHLSVSRSSVRSVTTRHPFGFNRGNLKWMATSGILGRPKAMGVQRRAALLAHRLEREFLQNLDQCLSKPQFVEPSDAESIKSLIQADAPVDVIADRYWTSLVHAHVRALTTYADAHVADVSLTEDPNLLFEPMGKHRTPRSTCHHGRSINFDDLLKTMDAMELSPERTRIVTLRMNKGMNSDLKELAQFLDRHLGQFGIRFYEEEATPKTSTCTIRIPSLGLLTAITQTIFDEQAMPFIYGRGVFQEKDLILLQAANLRGVGLSGRVEIIHNLPRFPLWFAIHDLVHWLPGMVRMPRWLRQATAIFHMTCSSRLSAQNLQNRGYDKGVALMIREKVQSMCDLPLSPCDSRINTFERACLDLILNALTARQDTSEKREDTAAFIRSILSDFRQNLIVTLDAPLPEEAVALLDYIQMIFDVLPEWIEGSASFNSRMREKIKSKT